MEEKQEQLEIVESKQEQEKKEEKKVEKIKYKYKLKSKMVKLPQEVKIPVNASELVVITKVKDLITYIFQITQNSPKKFRMTFIDRLQNKALDCIEYLIRANEVLLKKGGQ